MKFLLALVWALGGAAAGALVFGLGAAAWAQWTQMSSREGAAGYFVVGLALLGGLVGLLGGLLWFARGGGVPGQFLPRLGQGGLALGAVLALTALGVWAWMHTREAPVLVGGAQMQLLLEFRMPQAAAPAHSWPQALQVEVSTASTRMEAVLQPERVRQEDGQVVIPALLGPLVRSPQRLIAVRVRGPATPPHDELFMPSMPRSPDPAADWSGWSKPERLYDERGEPWSGPAQLAMRWRVRVYGQ